jgi:hypothetical protein
MFLIPGVQVVYGFMLLLPAFYLVANGPSVLHLVLTALIIVSGTISMFIAFIFGVMDIYLHTTKCSFFRKLYFVLFSKSEYTFIFPVLDRCAIPSNRLTLTDALAYEQHYKNNPNAFVGLRQIMIPFTSKDDALKWKMSDPNSHLFMRVCDAKWDKGFIKDKDE